MGFEDFFEHENKNRHHGHDQHDEHHYRPYGERNRFDRDSGHPYRGHGASPGVMNILAKIQANPGLKRLLIFAFIVLLLIAVTLVILLMPLIIKLVNYIGQVGLQGIFDYISVFIDRILKGSGK